MKRTVAIRLIPNGEQVAALRELQACFAAACNEIAAFAASERCTNRVRLHHHVYYLTRSHFPQLGCQMVCNAIASVARTLRSMRAGTTFREAPTFRSSGAVHFDARTYRLASDCASLFTMQGRTRIPVRVGAFQRGYFERGMSGEADLVLRRRKWFLHISVDIPETRASEGRRVLGVDLGENVIAALSSAKIYGGKKLRDRRDRFLALRARLQRNGSQSAKQLLARFSGRESRHVRHVNHEVSSWIVTEAVTNAYGTIALENLKNIRLRIRGGKRMRSRLHRWAWRQLQQFIEYKAEGAGISVIYVDPAYSSRTCANCGERGERFRFRFSCKECGIFAHSDRNAARNLAKIGASALASTGDVVRPNVAVRIGP